MTTFFHADDYGIDAEQARAILECSDACGGRGALNSVSIFANSPDFEKAAAIAEPFVGDGALKIALHTNLVEGYPCCHPRDIPLLIGPNGAFCHTFGSLLLMSLGSKRADLRRQVELECEAQIKRFIRTFPDQRSALRIDTHQHIHMIPLVLESLLEAVGQSNCTIAHLRIPVEAPLSYRASFRHLCFPPPGNLVKNTVLGILAHLNHGRLSALSCRSSLFCGVVFSGCMERIPQDLVSSTERKAHDRDADVEILFHPIRMEREVCLDPDNKAFTGACCSFHRDAEAALLRRLSAR